MWHGEFRDPRLVEVYDAECPWGWDDDFFMAVLAERSAPRVLDLGCGTGRLAIAMAAAGHEVTGVDPATAALDAARRKPGAARVRWVLGSAEKLPAATFDAAFLTSHTSQFIVGDQEWPAALRSLRNALVPGGRLIFDSRDPAARPWEKWNPEDSRRSIVLAGGEVVTAWTEVTAVGAEGLVSFTHHYRFSDGGHLTSAAQMRFRTEEDLRDALWTAGFRVDRIYGGWGREPVGLSEDGELIVIAVAETRTRK
ncbi:methyltransferase domain-containing protein [Actinoplanes sp. NPDC024001]|uniref:class I SAM-dependent methyltransferase n=1 Tax=Actinoplanes sp. NPDC024001 TaxID=3154598 RepID=UPI0033F24510